MESLVGYGSDDDNDNERNESESSNSSVPRSHSGGGAPRTKEDDTNYDDVNMDLSEESQPESEPELPPAEQSAKSSRHDQRGNETRVRDVKDRDRDTDRDADKRREEPDKRESRPDDRHARYDRDRDRDRRDTKRGLLGDKPADKTDKKLPSLMDVKPFGGDPPPVKSYDARDAVSPRFTERRDRDRDREQRDRDGKEREKERDRESRDKDSRDRKYRPDEKRSDRPRHERRRSRSRDRSERSKSKGHSHPPPSEPHSFVERRVSPPTASASGSGEFRSTSYKVNKKLEVMEKMGLQIKTPDGSMATAQQLRKAAIEAPAVPQPYYGGSGMNGSRILDQVQKRKLLWSNKNKSEAEEAAKWSGTRFAQDNDGKQVNKFMRLMGIKEPAAVKEAPPTADPIKKQEELFQAMQQQYEVARAATHTMRGVGLGFQRGQF